MNFYYTIKVFLFLLFSIALNHSIYSQCTEGDIILNGDFETGDLSSWTIMDLMNPIFPLSVDCSGSFNTGTGFGFVNINPWDGTCMAVNGFDGDGPGQISMHQTVTIPTGATATFNFSWWVAYDLTFAGLLDRMFEVHIQPVGGGAPISIPYSFTAPISTSNTGSGWVPVTLDLSAFAGQTFWLCFVETIPESFTGPAQIAIDGVSLIIECPQSCLADNGSLTIKALRND